MRSFGTSFFCNRWRPVFALPVDGVRRCFAHAFPPNVAVVGQCNVGKNRVTPNTGHAIWVGQCVGAGSHAKVACFGVDGVQLAVSRGLDPCNVVANGGDLPAVKACWWDQHRKVGLAASTRECRRHMVLFALRCGHAQNQHVLGQPAFITAHVGSNAQRKALFAQQRIAAVTGAV